MSSRERESEREERYYVIMILEMQRIQLEQDIHHNYMGLVLSSRHRLTV